MSTAPRSAASSELELVRHEYESSLSWRVTKPLRALGRVARGARPSSRTAPAGAGYDSWLEHFHGEGLARIDAVIAAGADEPFTHFRELDADVWALLLTQAYDVYPNIKA